VSLLVQALPSSQEVPSVFGVATHRFVSPSERHVPVLHGSVSSLQSASALHKTALTHSAGEELGDDDGYEQTSMSAGVEPIGKSVLFTQHCASVSAVVQFVPAQPLA
jgi:hypothetical protein